MPKNLSILITKIIILIFIAYEKPLKSDTGPDIEGVDFHNYHDAEKLKTPKNGFAFSPNQTTNPILIEVYAGKKIRHDIFSYRESIAEPSCYNAFKAWYYGKFAYNENLNVDFDTFVEAHNVLWLENIDHLELEHFKKSFHIMYPENKPFKSIFKASAFEMLLTDLKKTVEEEKSNPDQLRESLSNFKNVFQILSPFQKANEIFSHWMISQVKHRWAPEKHPQDITALECFQTKQTKKIRSHSNSPYPIVFLHGMAGQSRYLGVLDYWRGLQDLYNDMGVEAYFLNTHFIGHSFDRTPVLYAEIQKILVESKADKVHLIGHSQGGLDARVLVGAYDLAHKIASITTLSTPHHGTRAPRSQGAWTGMNFSEFYMENNFNIHFPRIHEIPFLSYGAIACAPHQTACWEKFPNAATSGVIFWPFIGQTFAYHADDRFAGANDGCVPLASAIWGKFQGSIRADHLDLIWGSNFDRFGFYREIARQLQRISHPPSQTPKF